MELRVAQAAEVAAVRGLLQANALPAQDLEDSRVELLVAVADGRVLGAVGLERHGSAGLLRSLVVDTPQRGSGLGQQLVASLEEHAAAEGIGRLVLLTQTAAPFFARRGYAVIDRGSAPVEVQASAEFRSLCPASATCMTKTLEAR